MKMLPRPDLRADGSLHSSHMQIQSVMGTCTATNGFCQGTSPVVYEKSDVGQAVTYELRMKRK